MNDITFAGRTRAGGYTALVLSRVDDALCITGAADGASEEEVRDALDMENSEPLVNVRAYEQPPRILRVLRQWVQRMGARHLVGLLKEALDRCPQDVHQSAGIVVDDHRYTITRLADGMRLRGEDTDLVLLGPIVTRPVDGKRWLHLKGLTQPATDGDR